MSNQNFQELSWGVDELAQFLGLSPRTVQDRASQRPDRLPPRIKKIGQRSRPRWLVSVVLAWAQNDVPASHAAEQTGRPKNHSGRPRKQVGSDK